MNAGELVSFVGAVVPMPVFHPACVGRAIECADQTGAYKIFPGDRVRVVEVRESEYALVTHAGLKGGVILCRTRCLQEIEETTTEDAAL